METYRKNLFYKLVTIKITLLFLLLWSKNSFSYDIQSRSKLLDDKFEAQKSWVQERDNDYFIDINFRNSSSMQKFLESLSSNFKDDLSAQSFLIANDKTEKNVGINLSLNIPLPSFSIFNRTIHSSFFCHSKVNYFQAIISTDLDCGMIALLIPPGLPSEIKDLFTCSYYNSLSPGDDLIANMPGLSAVIKTAYSGKFYKPLIEGTPYFHLFTEAKLNLGLNLSFPFRENFVFRFKIYASPEAAMKAMLSYSSLKGGVGDSNLFTPSLESFLKGNLSINYELDNLQVGAELNDFILKSIVTQDASAASKMKKAPLVNFYVKKGFRLGNIKARSFFGYHWRSLYKLYEGVYFGSDFTIPLDVKSFNLIFKGAFDPEYYSTSLLLASSLVDIGVKAKYPIRVKSNDIELTPLYNFHLNIHF
tara:strand:+ start:641 stop:1897 length:1257 start_codon:yes stop_codon:yes gene_type:complete